MFIAICLFSKFGFCVPIRNKEAATVAKVIVKHIFSTHGASRIISDLRSEFEAGSCGNYCKLLMWNDLGPLHIIRRQMELAKFGIGL